MASSTTVGHQQTLNNSALTVEEIIPTLIDQLSKARNTIFPPPSKHSINNSPENGSSGGSQTDPNNNANGNSTGNITSNANRNDANNGSCTSSEKEKDKDEEENAGNNASCWGFGFCNSDEQSVVNGQQTDDNNCNNASNGNNGNLLQVQLQLHRQLEKLERDLVFIKSAFNKLKDLQDFVSIQFNNLHILGQNLDTICSNITQMPNVPFPANQLQSKIRSLSDAILMLKLQIPLPQKISSANLDAKRYETGQEINARNVVDELLKLHKNKDFIGCSAFKDFQENFERLDIRLKLCLLCFAVFPENAIVKKRLLMHWWVGEGFVETGVGDEEKTVEEIADEILKQFIVGGFIEPDIKKKRLVGFRMHPLMRYVVISLAAKMGFLDFDPAGNPTTNFNLCQRACLVNAGEVSSRKVLMNTLESNPEKNLEKLQTLFNVNDPYPDFKLEWFLRMKNLNVLCLGRWQSSAKHHIEVEGTEFLRGLKNMKHLKYLSLQGISRINELPDSICKLANLRILDLNACHNLDTLPENIGHLKMLTHLDMSECYLVDQLPKGIGLLFNLQVLKGFVISDVKSRSSCTLDDLAKLRKLRKLSIHTSKKDFPAKEELIALHRLETLRKLTIAWAGKSAQEYSENSSEQRAVKSTELGPGNANHGRDTTKQHNGGAKPEVNRSVSMKLTRAIHVQRDTMLMRPELPLDLEKLDLQCFPGTGAPSWLRPQKLKLLNRLYIRGGNLHNLVQALEQNKWTVKILRLKFLPELKMEWRQLQKLFPDLIYLEKVKCPKLTLFPCDERGLWLNRKLISKQSLEGQVEFNWSFLAGRST